MSEPESTLPETHPMVAARVLIVDDDERTLRAVTAQLRGKTNAIRTASNGLDALTQAREWRPDVILLDVMMPGIDGFEVCRRLRADPELADCRVFFATALDDRTSRLEGFEAGADDFLTKPLDRVETLIRIGSIAKINRYRALIREHQAFKNLSERYAMPDSVAPELTPQQLEQAFDSAMAGLRLVVQPIVEVGPDGVSRPIAQEALMRTAPGAALPGPLALLAVAARLDRLPQLGQAVRRLAAQLVEHLPPEQCLFVNTSSSELLDDSIYDVDSPLSAHADRIVLELTEREPLDLVLDVSARVSRLRAQGFRFAVDDLGGGYSSLNTLAVIEPEFVKLDRVLVNGVVNRSTRGKIITSIVHLCQDLGVNLIAEGVETESERAALLGIGCRLQQGYLFQRPRAWPAARQ